MFLVTGANGQLGNEFRRIWGDKAVFVDRDELDITDLSAVMGFTKRQKFDWIVNCAAFTAVDKAEDMPDAARKVNVDGPKNLALSGIPILHISTDYVFDGENCKPYVETDEVNPLSVYAQTKADGEAAVLENASTAVVIRSSWLYSEFGNNFVKTMLRLGKEKERLNVVFDQVGTPTYARDLAEAIVEILPQVKNGSKEIYHYSNEGVCSWYDFASEIMHAAKLPCEVVPIESCEYPSAVRRPFYSVLNKGKIKKQFNLKINHWKESLYQCLEKLS